MPSIEMTRLKRLSLDISKLQREDVIGTEREFIAMVKDSFPELQSLMNTADRRRSTRIPVDHRNSRMLRQSISNYHGQSSSIQEEIVLLENHIDELKIYESAVPRTLPVEDEQMHEVERFIKTIGCSACKVRGILRSMEPLRRDSSTSVDYSVLTIEKRSSASSRYKQYHTLALSVYAAMSSYKEIIDVYYTKLVSNSQHRPMSYWVLTEDDSDMVRTPLLESDIMSNAARIKQKISLLEHETTEREKRIKEWHKLLSTTFQSKVCTSDDECSGSSGSSQSPPPSYDIEAGLVKVHDYPNMCKSGRKCLSPGKFCAAFLVTMILVSLLLGGVAAILYFFGGLNQTFRSDARTENNLSHAPTTVENIQIGYKVTTLFSDYAYSTTTKRTTPMKTTKKLGVPTRTTISTTENSEPSTTKLAETGLEITTASPQTHTTTTSLSDLPVKEATPTSIATSTYNVDIKAPLQQENVTVQSEPDTTASMANPTVPTNNNFTSDDMVEERQLPNLISTSESIDVLLDDKVTESVQDIAESTTTDMVLIFGEEVISSQSPVEVTEQMALVVTSPDPPVTEHNSTDPPSTDAMQEIEDTENTAAVVENSEYQQLQLITNITRASKVNITNTNLSAQVVTVPSEPASYTETSSNDITVTPTMSLEVSPDPSTTVSPTTKLDIPAALNNTGSNFNSLVTTKLSSSAPPLVTDIASRPTIEP